MNAPSFTNTALGVIALGALIAGCYVASPVMIPIILAVFLFFLLEPLVSWAEDKKISRKVSSPILVLFFALFSGLLGWGGYGGFVKLGKDIPAYTKKIRSAARSFQGKANEIQKGTQSLIPKPPQTEEVQKVEVVEGMGGGMTHLLLRGLDSVVAIVTGLFLIPILALFFLLEKVALQGAFERTLGSVFAVDRVGQELNKMIRGFFIGNFVVGLGTSVAFYALFSALHLENRVALALASGFLNLVPVLGAVLGAVFPVAQAILQFETASPLLILLGVSVFLHFFVANLVIPKVIGSRINVNAASATIGLLFWSWLWGGIGLLLAVPLTAMVRILLSSHANTAPWADFLAEGPTGAINRIILPKRFIRVR